MRDLNSREISAVFGGRAAAAEPTVVSNTAKTVRAAQAAQSNGTITIKIGNAIQYTGSVADLSATITLAKAAIVDVAYEAADSVLLVQAGVTCGFAPTSDSCSDIENTIDNFFNMANNPWGL